MPGCPVRSSGPRAPAAPAARKRDDKQSRAVRPDSVRPLPHTIAGDRRRGETLRLVVASSARAGTARGPARLNVLTMRKSKDTTGRHCLSHIATRGRAASGEPNLTRVGVAPGANIGGHPHTTSRKEPKLSILTGTERAPGHKKTRRRKPSRDHPNRSRTPGARRPAETSWLVKARRRTLGHAAFRTHHRSAARAGISHTAVA